MRIIIDVRLLSKGGSSGIEEYTRNLVSSIVEHDTENEYTLFYNGWRKVPITCQLDGRPIDKCRVVSKSIPNKLFDATSRFLNWPKVEDLARFDPGVKAATTPGSTAVFSPHFNILSTNLPHIITFHDLSFLHHPDFFSRKQRVWHWLQNYKKTAAQAARIIAISEFTKHDLVNLLGVPPEKTSVIYSGIHPSFRPLPPDSPELAEFKNKYKLTAPFVLYLGTLEPRKNVPALIRAFDILKQNPAHRDLELVLAGPVGWLADEVFREARQARARAQIRFLGHLKAEDRVLLYNASSVFAFPSFFEGFGFPPLEAQACGVPVVASNRTSLPEILGTSAKLINPWRVGDIAGALEELLTPGAERERAIQEGIKNASRFTWAEAAKKTIEVYNKI